MAAGSFATSISCIDGRIQGPISDWIRKNHNVDFVDTITEPGVDKRICEMAGVSEELRKKAAISVRAHGSKLIIVSGHADCAGNPVSDGEHKEQIAEGVRKVESWGLGAAVLGAWVGHDWKVSQA